MFPDNEIRLGSLDSTGTTKVLDAESQAQFVPQGHLLFVRQGTLLAQPFDAESVTPAGELVPLVEQVYVDGNSYRLSRPPRTEALPTEPAALRRKHN